MSEAARVRKVTMIPQRIQPLTQLPLHAVAKRKVAGYARVSTDSEEQENSYEAQVEYFTDYIKIDSSSDARGELDRSARISASLSR